MQDCLSEQWQMEGITLALLFGHASAAEIRHVHYQVLVGNCIDLGCLRLGMQNCLSIVLLYIFGITCFCTLYAILYRPCVFCQLF